MKKRYSVLAAAAVLAIASVAFIGFDSKTSVATAAKKTYTGTVYVAGMGGHFAKSTVTIDPNSEDKLVTVKDLDRVEIGSKASHPTHDARIDVNDANTLFWSTYVLDKDGKSHVGKTDLKTGKVVKDVAISPDPRATGKAPLYCASGQTKKSYLPVFMGSEAYVDVFDKATLDKKHRLYVSDLGYKAGSYKFVHGVNSPDMKSFLLAINQAGEDKKGNGKVDFVLVDLNELENGKWKELKRATHTGAPDKTLTFRMYFSNDSKQIFQSAADRLWVLDAATLKLVDEKMMPEGAQLHDAMPTPDNKYALLTLRELAAACDMGGEPLAGKSITDGTLMVYDADAKKIGAKTVSVCQACHKASAVGDKNAILCGLDANWKK